METVLNPTVVSAARSHGGWQRVYEHRSAVLDCSMRFGVYEPPELGRPRWVLYWLSGLTCTEQNFITKSGFQAWAAELGAIVVAPDTSPRGDRVADDPDRWDLGQGAGFYVNATEEPWARHYRMYDYVLQELPEAIASILPAIGELPTAIAGHSMGGLGALVLGLRNPGRYRSISAFSPIVNPSQVPWGQGAFGHYLGSRYDTWRAYDPTALIGDYAAATGRDPQGQPPILIDQGTADGFLGQQLQPEVFRDAGQAVGYPVTLRLQPDYDHSYYFVATFLRDHFVHHAAHCTGDRAI
jgi:S-formylglutathione hydrolase